MPRITAEELARQIGKEGYKSPRDQFIYSRYRPPIAVVAVIWNTNKEALREKLKRAIVKGDDWRVARREHLKAISAGIAEATRIQVTEESDDVIAVYRQCVSITVTRCQQLLVERQADGKNLVPILPSNLNAIARTLDVCYQLEDKISGRKAVLDAHQKRQTENTWFVEIVKRHVRDPDILRALGIELTIRRAVIDSRLEVDLADLNDLEQDGDTAGKAMATSAELEVREVKDVTPTKPGEAEVPPPGPTKRRRLKPKPAGKPPPK